MRLGIAGAGLTGRTFAWRALLAGHSVELFEAGRMTRSRAAAYTAAGMVAPLSEVVSSEPQIYSMGLRSIELWRAWTQELDAAAEPVSFTEAGSIAVAHPRDSAELVQFARDLTAKLGNLDDGAGFRWLDRDELRRKEPDLAVSFDRGLLLEREAHIDNRRLLDALLAEIRRLGGVLHERCAVEISAHRIVAPHWQDEFDCVIDCRGYGAKDDLDRLRGVRGELMRVECRDIYLSRPIRLMHPRYQLYIVPQPQHHFVVGASEIESEDRTPISLQSLLELGSALYSLNPAFAEARIVETGVNLRPAFMDNLPRIDAAPGLVRVNGLYRHGYLLAPVLVERMLDELRNAQRAAPCGVAISG